MIILARLITAIVLASVLCGILMILQTPTGLAITLSNLGFAALVFIFYVLIEERTGGPSGRGGHG